MPLLFALIPLVPAAFAWLLHSFYFHEWMRRLEDDVHGRRARFWGRRSRYAQVQAWGLTLMGLIGTMVMVRWLMVE